MNAATNIRNRELSIGTWLTTGTTMITELAGQMPFHWLLLDMEHGNINTADLLPNFQAIGNSHTAIIVRVPAPEPSIISKVLDLGAHGIMMPHASDARQVENCIQSMYYPPKGTRGYSGSVRAYQYGRLPADDIKDTKPLLFVQIEDISAVDNIRSIAAINEVDVLFVGPADLKLSLLAAASHSLTYQSALQKVTDAAAEYQKKAGILLRNYNEIDNTIKNGFSCIGIDSDMAILRKGYEEIFRMLPH